MDVDVIPENLVEMTLTVRREGEHPLAMGISCINTAAEEKCMSAVLFSGVIELWRGI